MAIGPGIANTGSFGYTYDFTVGARMVLMWQSGRQLNTAHGWSFENRDIRVFCEVFLSSLGEPTPLMRRTSRTKECTGFADRAEKVVHVVKGIMEGNIKNPENLLISPVTSLERATAPRAGGYPVLRVSVVAAGAFHGFSKEGKISEGEVKGEWPGVNWCLVSVLYYTKDALQGESTGSHQCDLNVHKFRHSNSRYVNMIQGSLRLDNGDDDGCTTVVKGFHKNVRAWWEEVIARGADKGHHTFGITNTKGLYTDGDEARYGKCLPTPYPRGASGSPALKFCTGPPMLLVRGAGSFFHGLQA
ncbi:hypothetical protein BDZ91DRAFT_796331 [Kalaharituber pfeilii]|nr:hypothetical protein BDZ91DRAFT_796331 [Kalaharituber pfeilii]